MALYSKSSILLLFGRHSPVIAKPVALCPLCKLLFASQQPAFLGWIKASIVTVTLKKMGLRKSDTCVHTYITSKQIELESPGCTGFEENSKCFKT